MSETLLDLPIGAIFTVPDSFFSCKFIRCENFSCGYGIYNCVSLGEKCNFPHFYPDNEPIERV